MGDSKLGREALFTLIVIAQRYEFFMQSTVASKNPLIR